MTESAAQLQTVQPDIITSATTLQQILEVMQAVDDGLYELTPEQMRELAEAAEVKVDGYYYMIEKFEAEAARLDMRIKAFQAAKRSAQGKVESLKKLITYRMKAKGLDKMPGQDFQVSLRRSASVKIKAEANGDLYAAFGEFMRMKFEWDKHAIKAAIEGKNAEVLTVAEIEENFSPVFKPRGGDA